MDKSTATGEKLYFARCFIEIEDSKPLPKIISIEMEEGDTLELQVEFEWVSPVCKRCSTFGHQAIQCPTTHTWLPKDKHQDVSKLVGNQSCRISSTTLDFSLHLKVNLNGKRSRHVSLQNVV